MNWTKRAEIMRPHVVRITTPDASGTGFILHINKKSNKLTVATAAHVVRNARSWRQYINIHHSAFTSPLVSPPSDEYRVLLHPQFDSACVVVDLPEPPWNDAFPKEPIEHVPVETIVPSGEEVGWLGFPYMVNSNRPCFFGGHISAFADRRYFIDGVAIPGVSGGPAFRWSMSHKKLQILGSVSAYSPNRAGGEVLPGLMVADDCTQWPEVLRETLDT